MILSLARKHVTERKKHEKLQNGRTIESLGFTLKGKTLGLQGYGAIARDVAEIAREGFKMNILYFDPFVKESYKDTKVDSLEELYALSNIVSVHVPLVNSTRESVNKDVLSNVKDDFMLINTSRGMVLNSQDIIEFLKNGKLSFLGVDVWGSDDHFSSDLLRRNVFQTDHVAFYTEEAVKSILEQTLKSLHSNPASDNELSIN